MKRAFEYGIKTQGITISGTKGSQAGFSVSLAGDFDDDGKQDWLVSAPDANNFAGQVSIVLSHGLTAGSIVNLDNLGMQGITINGTIAYSLLGWSISTAGDFDNDNKQDWLIAVPDQANAVAQAYVVFSGELAAGNTTNINNLFKQNQEIQMIDTHGTSATGISVSEAGDFDGDGKQDWLVGVPTAEFNTGQAYIIFSNGLAGGDSIDLGYLGLQGIKMGTSIPNSLVGSSVSLAGDFDGDGKQDWLIGAPGTNNFSGQTYVVLSKNLSGGDYIDLSNLGQQGIILNGTINSASGSSVSLAGDFDGDGKQDWLIGAPNNAIFEQQAQAYVVLSGNLAAGDTVDLSNIGMQGITFNGGINSWAGISVSLAGDFDGDGKQDWLIGASHANNATGQAYVVFSNSLSRGDQIDLTNLSQQGITLNGDINSHAGSSVSLAGDIDDDGKQDWLIGAPWIDSQAGQAYVVISKGLSGGDIINLWELASNKSSKKHLAITAEDGNPSTINSKSRKQSIDISVLNEEPDILNAETSTASSLKLAFPDIGSTGMLAIVLGKLVMNTVQAAYETGKRWWYGAAAKIDVSAAEMKHAKARFNQLEAYIDKLLRRRDLDIWYQDGLEMLKEELEDANYNNLSLSQVEDWEERLDILEKDYSPVSKTKTLSVMKQAYSNRFFKAAQQPVIPEQQAALPQIPTQAPHIAG